MSAKAVQPTRAAMEHLALQKYSAATIVALAMSKVSGFRSHFLFFLGKKLYGSYLLI